MKINMAYIRERATSGGWINFAVFEAKSTNNNELLLQLTQKARRNNLKVDQSALAFQSNGRIKFYGDKNLVSYLSKGWNLRWTHTLDI